MYIMMLWNNCTASWEYVKENDVIPFKLTTG
jgi:hypothetical protein